MFLFSWKVFVFVCVVCVYFCMIENLWIVGFFCVGKLVGYLFV